MIGTSHNHVIKFIQSIHMFQRMMLRIQKHLQTMSQGDKLAVADWFDSMGQKDILTTRMI